MGGAAGGRWDAGRSRARLKGGRPGLGVRVQEGISPEIAARRVSERRGEERDDRRGWVAVRQERERANGVRGSVLSCGPRASGRRASGVSARRGGREAALAGGPGRGGRLGKRGRAGARGRWTGRVGRAAVCGACARLRRVGEGWADLGERAAV